MTVLAFLLFLNIGYNLVLRQQMNAVNEQALALWMQSTEARLNTVHDHLYEVLLTIYNTVPVTHGSSPMGFEATRQLQTTLDDKLIICDDADCFFVSDTDTGWFLFQSNKRLNNLRTLQFKDFAQANLDSYSTGLHEMNWYLVPFEDEVYLIKTITIGKYTAGAMCNTLNFDITKTLALFGDETACMILFDDDVYYGAGVRSWTDDLLFRKDGTPYLDDGRLTVYRDFPLVNCRVVLAAWERSLWAESGFLAPLLLAAASVICLALIILLHRFLRKKVMIPTQHLLQAHNEIADGNIRFRIMEDAGSSEFNSLYKSFNNMAGQITSLRIESYDRLIREQENQLQLVRAQIKPHFFLNAITTVSNMTYQNRTEDIRTFLQVLSRYMRYMLNIRSRTVSVSEELDHIRNYLKMQEIRFPGSISAEIDCTEEAADVQIPFLILFTLVENTFKHAMDLYSHMKLCIKCEKCCSDGIQGYELTVRDNGPGFPENILEAFAAESTDEGLPPKDHLGLSNIRYTLKVMYGRKDLLRLSNTEDGACAVIIIPTEEINHEATDL